MLSPPLITSFILAIAMTCSALIIWSQQTSRELIVIHRWPLLAIVVTGALLRFPFSQPFFHGFEYEDCFVHQAVARQILEPSNPINLDGTYRECIFSVGSLDAPDEHQCFYHFIGYPAAIRMLQFGIGDVATAAHWVSYAASVINIALVFLLASLCDVDRRTPWIAACAYACIPLSISHAATTSSEVLSSLFVTLVVMMAYFSARLPTYSMFVAVALNATLAASLLIRRENFVLTPLVLLATCFAPMWTAPAATSSLRARLCLAAFTLSVQGAFALIVLDLVESIQDEQAVAGAGFVSLANLARIGAAFLHSFTHMKFYSVFAYFLLLSPLVIWRYPGTRLTSVVLVVFLIMYSAHWRSYEFLRAGSVSVWDTHRYAMNVLPLISVLSAVGVSLCIGAPFRSRIRQSWLAATGQLTVVGVLAASSVAGVTMRVRFTWAEQKERVGPIRRLLDKLSARENAWVLTFEPCLVQAYAPTGLQTVDLAMIHRVDQANLDRLLERAAVFALVRPWDFNEQSRLRRAEQFKWFESMEWDVVDRSPDGILFRRLEPDLSD